MPHPLARGPSANSLGAGGSGGGDTGGSSGGAVTDARSPSRRHPPPASGSLGAGEARHAGPQSRRRLNPAHALLLREARQGSGGGCMLPEQVGWCDGQVAATAGPMLLQHACCVPPSAEKKASFRGPACPSAPSITAAPSPCQTLYPSPHTSPRLPRRCRVPQCAHFAAFHRLPSTPTRVVDRRTSRGYIGQFTADGNIFIAAFQHERKIRLYEVRRRLLLSQGFSCAAAAAAWGLA